MVYIFRGLINIFCLQCFTEYNIKMNGCKKWNKEETTVENPTVSSSITVHYTHLTTEIFKFYIYLKNCKRGAESISISLPSNLSCKVEVCLCEEGVVFLHHLNVEHPLLRTICCFDTELWARIEASDKHFLSFIRGIKTNLPWLIMSLLGTFFLWCLG